MDLKQPKAKRHRARLKVHPPLPIIKASDKEIHKFSGYFNGFTIVIKNSEEMRKLNEMGSFGKGNLSRGHPSRNQAPPILRRRMFDKRTQHKTDKKQIPEKVIVVPDSDSENEDYFTNLKPEYQIDSSGLKETLNLCLEEAFFLFRSIKCLNIHHFDKQLDEQEIWDLFCKTDQYFVQNYPVYHHFRAKNWIVKPGIKFGGDYLLYKEGPSYYHSSYIIVIDVLDGNTMERRKDLCRRSMKTVNILGLNRVCETVGKELLICQLFWPPDLITIQPQDLPKFTINETLIRRWVSAQNRDVEESA